MIEVAPATDAELARVYRADGEHFAGRVNGELVAYIGFRTTAGRRWGMYDVLSTAARSVWGTLFYQFRRELRRQKEPIYVLARDAEAMRLLRLLGLKPTGETYMGKDMWIWTPDSSF